MPPQPMILTASQWGMPGPLGPKLTLPVGLVALHHTAAPATHQPIEDARAIARTGIARFGRMSYTVLIHPARVIFWAQTEHIGAHLADRNSKSVGIALIGNYQFEDPPDLMIYDACLALHSLRAFGIVASTPRVEPHQAFSATACPGSQAVAKVLPFLRAVAADPSWRP